MDTRAKSADLAALATPAIPNAIPELVAPFGPSGGKSADLMSARADVAPISLGACRVLSDRVEEAAALPVVGGHQLVNQPLGVNPAQRAGADAEPTVLAAVTRRGAVEGGRKRLALRRVDALSPIRSRCRSQASNEA